MEVLSPVGIPEVLEKGLASRLRGLTGRTVALLDNSKVNASSFLDRVAFHLEARGAKIIRLSKQTASKPAEPGTLERLLRCDALINAFGD